MRHLIAGAALCALLLPACGGGTTLTATGPGSGGGSNGSATLQGTVYESNGQTVDRSGIRVAIVETGAVTFTGADGSFTFGGLEPGTYTIDFGGVTEGFDDESEDALGRPYVDIVNDGDTVEMRFAVLNGVAQEFSMNGGKRDSKKVQLEPEEGFETVEAELKVENEGSVDFEFEIEVEPIELTDEVEIFIDDKSGNGFVSVGLAINEFEDDGSHEAEYERETEDGQALPLGALTLEDMVGWCVRVDINGVTAFTGMVPEAPTGRDDDDDDGHDDDDDEMEGKADLMTLVAGIEEAEVEIEKWANHNVQEFEMEIEGTAIAPGDKIAFEIQDDDENWVLIKSVIAEDDDDGGEAEIDTDDGDPFPLDVTDVEDLVGRKVRIRRDEDDDETVLAEGTVPALVQT